MRTTLSTPGMDPRVSLTLAPIALLVFFLVAHDAATAPHRVEPTFGGATITALALLYACAAYFGTLAAFVSQLETPIEVGCGLPLVVFAIAVGTAPLGNQADAAPALATALAGGFVLAGALREYSDERAARTEAPNAVRRPVVVALRCRGPQHLAHASCQVCGDALSHDVVACVDCDTPHHAECWEYAGACSTYGCGCRLAA